MNNKEKYWLVKQASTRRKGMTSGEQSQLQNWIRGTPQQPQQQVPAGVTGKHSLTGPSRTHTYGEGRFTTQPRYDRNHQNERLPHLQTHGNFGGAVMANPIGHGNPSFANDIHNWMSPEPLINAAAGGLADTARLVTLNGRIGTDSFKKKLDQTPSLVGGVGQLAKNMWNNPGGTVEEVFTGKGGMWSMIPAAGALGKLGQASKLSKPMGAVSNVVGKASIPNVATSILGKTVAPNIKNTLGKFQKSLPGKAWSKYRQAEGQFGRFDEGQTGGADSYNLAGGFQSKQPSPEPLKPTPPPTPAPKPGPLLAANTRNDVKTTETVGDLNKDIGKGLGTLDAPTPSGTGDLAKADAPGSSTDTGGGTVASTDVPQLEAATPVGTNKKW